MTHFRLTASTLGLLALSSIVFGMDVSVTSSLSFDTAAAKNRPVSKVITLLKDMLAQLEKESEEDEEIYDKMACWCETNDKAKTKAIEDGKEAETALNAAILEFTAKSAQLTAEIDSLNKDIKEKTDGLDQ